MASGNLGLKMVQVMSMLHCTTLERRKRDFAVAAKNVLILCGICFLIPSTEIDGR